MKTIDLAMREFLCFNTQVSKGSRSTRFSPLYASEEGCFLTLAASLSSRPVEPRASHRRIFRFRPPISTQLSGKSMSQTSSPQPVPIRHSLLRPAP